MRALTRISEGLDRGVTLVGRMAGWVIFALIAVTVFDVITRRFFVLGSTKLQEMEWHLHAILFTLCLGFAFLKGAHVRIELISARFSDITRAWVELICCVLFLLPFCALLIWFGTGFAFDSFMDGETSSSATGLGHRWLIKIFLPIGFLLLAMSGLAIALRNIVLIAMAKDGR